MKPLPRHCPSVLTIAGHDPCGGAGIQADIEAVVSAGARALSLVTALTTQNSLRFEHCEPVSAQALSRQGRVLLEDLRPAAVKIGLVPSADIAAAIAGLLDTLPGTPVVCDPVIAAGAGSRILAPGATAALRDCLLPRTLLLTPNVEEVRELGGSPRVEEAVERLLARGVQAVLVTGTHTRSTRVRNILYRPNRPRRVYECVRLPGVYHGSGCTLASAIAARLALGLALEQAVEQALDYTWKSLALGERAGGGQHLPDRLFALAGLK